jgi:hypothetical protein
MFEFKVNQKMKDQTLVLFSKSFFQNNYALRFLNPVSTNIMEKGMLKQRTKDKLRRMNASSKYEVGARRKVIN